MRHLPPSPAPPSRPGLEVHTFVVEATERRSTSLAQAILGVAAELGATLRSYTTSAGKGSPPICRDTPRGGTRQLAAATPPSVTEASTEHAEPGDPPGGGGDADQLDEDRVKHLTQHLTAWFVLAEAWVEMYPGEYIPRTRALAEVAILADDAWRAAHPPAAEPDGTHAATVAAAKLIAEASGLPRYAEPPAGYGHRALLTWPGEGGPSSNVTNAFAHALRGYSPGDAGADPLRRAAALLHEHGRRSCPECATEESA